MITRSAGQYFAHGVIANGFVTEAGQLADLFRLPPLQQQFDQAGHQLLLVLGMHLIYRRTGVGWS
ncbi:hypothetical protein ACFY9A_39785 [Streptomyces rubradiris]|uniref:hypothetical protein n=1 Tax=Streptomyces rubradiris TaxID=285531 RepID=UPI0036E7C0F0